MFLLAALAVLTAPDGVHRQYLGNGVVRTVDIPRSERLAPFLADPQLRPGAGLGAVLLVVPFSLLGWQALRTGTAARERRLAALSLAGATRAQLRRLAHLEGMRAAVIGGLLLLVSDLVAQHVIPVTLPVGVVTVVLGGLYLVWLLVREARRPQ